MFSTTVVALCAVLGAGMGWTAQPSTAAPSSLAPPPPTGTTISLTGFSDVVVDDAFGRVFVTQRDDTLMVASADLSTHESVMLDGPGRAMALNDDGSVLYVVVDAVDQIAAVDTKTLEVTTVPATVSPCPQQITYADDLLWVASSCAQGAGVVAVDPATGAVTEVDDRPSAYVLDAGDGLLVTATRTGEVRSFEIGGADGSPALTLLGEATLSGTIDDLAVSADGARLFSATGYPSYRLSISGLPGLAYEGPADIGTLGNAAVAVRQDGLIGASGDGGVQFATPAGRSTYGPQNSGEWGPQTGGLAFGTHLLYTVLGNPYSKARYLTSYRPGWRSTLHVKNFNVERTIDLGDSVTVTGDLATRSDNRTVAVYGTRHTLTAPVALGTTVAGSDGRFSISVRPGRTMTLMVVFEGDDENVGAVEIQDGSVYVRARVTSELRGARRVRDHVAEYGVHDRALIVAKVAPAQPGRCATVDLDVRVAGRWRAVDTVRCLRLDDRSRLRAYVQGDRELAGVLWRIRAVAPSTDIAEPNTGPTHRFRFVR
ncbi:hypothetical protein [Nocardioides sp. MH1]|uniref:hypothetical protein n=1 Tax=Nocardioides sp. MH1 TaxID=3242490 RepID=UPI003521D320